MMGTFPALTWHGTQLKVRLLCAHWSLSMYSLCLNLVLVSDQFWTSTRFVLKWAAPSEFGTYRLCEQRRFRRACASAQSRQNLRCSLIQAVSQEEPSDRKPDPWPLWMAGHAQLKFVMTECSKTQIRLAGLKCSLLKDVALMLHIFRKGCPFWTKHETNIWKSLYILL